jgi:hypothetical protein
MALSVCNKLAVDRGGRTRLCAFQILGLKPRGAHARRSRSIVEGLELWSTSMATQIVMDQTGDTRHYFNADDAEALFKAEERC